MPVPADYADDLFMPPEARYAVVYVGPCTVATFEAKKIPLDGRKYVMHGSIRFRTSASLRAKLVIDTTDFDFLELDGTFVYFNGLWYRWDEDALYTAMGTSKDAALPFTWLPDFPLDHDEQGPYPMRAYGEETS